MPSAYRRNIVVGPKTWAKLKSLARKEERSMSDIIREALMELFKRRMKQNPAEEYDPITDNYRKR